MILYNTASLPKPWYGSFRSANSISVMPNAHMSLFSPAPLFPSLEKTSGAQYSGVPAWAVLLDQEWFNWSDKPKSASWIKPLLDIRQFDGLISYAFISFSITHSVKHMLAVKIRQSKNETTRHFSQFSFCQFISFQSISTVNVWREWSTLAIVHYNLVMSCMSYHYP